MTTITDLIDGQYRDYSRYVVFFRAIPSLMDGLKTSQRKIIWTAMNFAKSFTKTAALCGQVVVEADYHHGEVSLQDAASLMAAKWSNNFPLLEGDGNFGSRIIQVPAAARYTSVKIHPDASKVFLDSKDCPKVDDGNEPKFFLPILPILAINGAEGVAVGFATSIFPRSVETVKAFVSKILDGKISEADAKKEHLTPRFPQFRGTVEPLLEKGKVSWLISGSIQRPKKNTVIITELPYDNSYDREGYIGKLDKLLEKGVISDYTDETAKGQFRFSIKIPNELDKKSNAEIMDVLKLVVRNSENIVAIDTADRVRNYESIGELIWDFVQSRQGFYRARFERLQKEISEDLSFARARHWMIKDSNEGNLHILEKQISKAIQARRISDCLYDHDFPKEQIDKMIDGLVNTPIYYFTDDMLKILEAEIMALQIKLQKVLMMQPVEEFKKDLMAV